MPDPKPFLILQLRPEDLISNSEYACIAKYSGLPSHLLRRLRIEKQGIPKTLNINDYAAVIVGGSPFDISTPEHQKTGIQKTVENDFQRLFDQILPADFPFLGCCSGNGLLGAYLGSPISRKYGEPVSCTSVQLTDEGKNDKLLTGFPDAFDVLLGHKEACDITPAAATLLVSGHRCPVQMFRVKKNIYATQFHPEGDAEEFILRINAYKNHGYFNPEEAELLKQEVSRKPTPYAQTILRRFAAYYSNRVHINPF